MKKIISIITTILLIWAMLMFVDYVRAYQNEGDLLIRTDMEVTDEYTKKAGLGYYVKLYNYDPSNMKNGQVMKEFAIFNIVVSKEIAQVNNG